VNEERPSLQIPVPDENDARLYEEWRRQQEEKKQEQDNKERVVVIEI
jgi:hypothetical protein